MEPQIIERGELILAGMTFYGAPFASGEGWSSENEIGKLWGRFNALWDRARDQITGLVDPDTAYEVHVEPPEYEETQQFYVTVGVEVDRVSPSPLELAYRVLPATTYAVFTLVGDEIRSDWPKAIYKEWLPQSEYEEAFKFTIERYGPGFKGMDDPTSELEIMVPVRHK
jgi:predicted transcriptional regulator YdeE